MNRRFKGTQQVHRSRSWGGSRDVATHSAPLSRRITAQAVRLGLALCALASLVGCARTSTPAPAAVAPATSPAPHAGPAPTTAPLAAAVSPAAAPPAGPPAAPPAALRLPTTTADLDRWLKASGCPWAAGDGSEVLCWHHEVRTTDHHLVVHTVALDLIRAPGEVVQKFVLYADGPAVLAASALRPHQLRSVVIWLRDHRGRRGRALRSAVKITHNRFTLLWEGVHWGMPLKKPPSRAPTAKLRGREGLCCGWLPADATYFDHCGLAAVRLRLACDWHAAARDRRDLCFDPSLAVKPVPARPTYAVHFLPVGGMGR